MKPPYDHTPPQDVQAERAVLGAVLLNRDALDATVSIIGVDPSMWYLPAHAQIWGAMLCLEDAGHPVDVLTLANLLGGEGLDRVGGAAYLGELTNVVPTSSNAEHYANIVKDMAIRRALILAGQKIVGLGFTPRGDSSAQDLVESADKALFEVSAKRRAEVVHLSSGIDAAVAELHMLAETKRSGVPLGLNKIDERLGGGWQSGEFIVVGARPSVGKTAFGIQCAHHAAMNGTPALFFSLEMKLRALAQRWLCLDGQVRLDRIRTGFLSANNLVEAQKAAERLKQAPIWVDDSPYLSTHEIKAKSRKLFKQHKVGLILIDYMQLVRPPRREHQRYLEIAGISMELKGLAGELNVPVVALAQLSRDAADRRPRVSDLKEGGAIEQDADVILLLHETTDADKAEILKNKKRTLRGNLLVDLAKQRNGPRGLFDVEYDYETQRFSLADENTTAERAEEQEEMF